MSKLKLNRKIDSTVSDFMSTCEIDYSIDDPTLLDENDSSWRDASTGYRMIHDAMRIVFHPTTKEEYTLLHTKFFGELEVVQ